MPAPDLETIYKFEDFHEEATRLVLEEEGNFDEGLNFYTTQSDAEVEWPLIAIKFISGAATGKCKAFSDTDVRDVQFRFQLIFQIETERTRNAPNHAPYRAKVRRTMMQFVEHFNETRLPYHAIANLTDGGNTPEVSGENNVDISTMLFNGVFAIRDTAWPE